MVRGSTRRTAVVATIAIAAGTGHASLALLYIAFFLLGTGQVFFDNADQAFLPDIVSDDAIERANARLQAGTLGAGQLGGPAIGSLLFSIAVAVPFAFDAATFAAASLLVFTIHGNVARQRTPSLRPDASRRSLRDEIREGLSYLLHHKLLRRLAVILGSMNMLDLVARSTFVLFAQQRLHLSDLGFGIVLTMWAVGGIAGGIIADRLGPRRPQHILATTIALMTVGYVAIPVFVNPYVTGGAFFLSGIAAVLWNVITVSARQQVIPSALFGRVNSVYRLLAWGALPIGAAAGGLIAHRFGLRAPYVVAAIGHVILFAAAVLWLPISAIDEARYRAATQSLPSPP